MNRWIVIVMGLGLAACGPQISSRVRPADARRTFAEHRGGVALYSEGRKPQLPYDDVASITVTGRRNPGRDAMEHELRQRARAMGATAVLNLRWHVEVEQDDGQIFRVALQNLACLDDIRFCAFGDRGPAEVQTVILSGFAVRVRREPDAAP
jgi:hypothetical protein